MFHMLQKSIPKHLKVEISITYTFLLITNQNDIFHNITYSKIEGQSIGYHIKIKQK